MGPLQVTCCAWWSTFDGAEIALIGTKTGEVIFWQLPEASLLRVLSFGAPVDRLEVAVDDADEVQVGRCAPCCTYHSLSHTTPFWAGAIVIWY